MFSLVCVVSVFLLFFYFFIGILFDRKFPFKTKYNNSVTYSVNSNYYLFSREKQEKDCQNNSLIKSTVELYLL